mgnify:CR=1 FL=1
MMNENVIFEEDEHTPDCPIAVGEGFGDKVRARESDDKTYFGTLIDRETGCKSITEGVIEKNRIQHS